MTTCNCQIETGECQGPDGCRAIAEIERLTAENEKLCAARDAAIKILADSRLPSESRINDTIAILARTP